LAMSTDEQDRVWADLDAAIRRSQERLEENADLLAEYWAEEDLHERNEQYEALQMRHQAGDDGCLWQVLVLLAVGVNLWAQVMT